MRDISVDNFTVNDMKAMLRSPQTSARQAWLGLAVSLAAVTAVAAGGSAISTESIRTWYAGMIKPEWSPPNWVFPAVWTPLYLIMAVSAWLVWLKRDQEGARAALVVYGIQLLLNGLWSPLFFALQAPTAALVDAVLLWAAVAVTIAMFYQVRLLAALLLVPYLCWVSFAVSLNAAIVALN